MYGGKFAFQNRWGRASLRFGGKLPFLLCFTLYFRAISKCKPGLYLQGLIFGILGYIKTRLYKHWLRKALEGQGEDGHQLGLCHNGVCLTEICMQPTYGMNISFQRARTTTTTVSIKLTAVLILSVQLKTFVTSVYNDPYIFHKTIYSTNRKHGVHLT